MSRSDVPLVVTATDLSSEVMVVDGDFQVLARGLQCVELRVPPGIYRARALVGSQHNEMLFSVEATDSRKTVQIPAVEFSSPIPLAQTATSRDYHQNALSAAVHNATDAARLGAGSQIVIFLRDPSDLCFSLEPHELARYAENFDGFVLSKWDGNDRHALKEIGVFEPQRGYLVASVQANPGAYALSLPYRDNNRQFLPLVVPAGWSLHVYITMDEIPPTGLGRRANLDEAAIVLDRLHVGFEPNRTDLKVLEVARHALARGHNVLQPAAMSQLLEEKFANPMMGIMAAHLMLLEPQPNLPLVQTVVENTGSLIGAGFPDLLALSYRLKSARPDGASIDDANQVVAGLRAPPMLQRSWHFLMEAWRKAPQRPAPTHGEPFSLANRLVSSSVWLSWESDASPESGLRLKPHAPASRGISIHAISEKLSGYVGYVRERVSGTHGSVPLAAPALEALTLDALARVATAIDWRLVVKLLKAAEMAGRHDIRLSLVQRQLILTLKAAREQVLDDGELDHDFLERLLRTADVPSEVIKEEMARLVTVATNLIAKTAGR
ncbi:hypothetical protein ACIP1U_23955 [Cupriavidus sp. NPDC089707]|uniref:hypothetical protein n=1 Tax=Cupriavidus sp. NPDC089707 TaxID=3363963 RepID=UPI00381DB543